MVRRVFLGAPKNMCCRSIAALLMALIGPMAVADILVVDTTGQPVPSAIVLLADSDSNGVSKDIIVDQIDRHFEPFVSITTPGSRVRFPNSDDIRHHVYSFSDAKTFELKLYHANDAEPVEFERAGMVTLGCNVHDTMKAYVLVTPNPGAVSDDTGRARINTSDVTEVEVWHPQAAQWQTLPVSDGTV